jgi:gamma-glutamyl-gamma-aminobutyrate hydrolase PuuD
MKKIAITQRVEKVESYNEYRDCLDQNWSDLLCKIGLLPFPIPNNLNNPIDWIKSFEIDGLILSGGNDLTFTGSTKSTSKNRDYTEMELLKFAMIKKIPVLGICRGLQILNIFLGGKVSPIDNHVGVDHLIFINKENNNELSKIGYPYELMVNSFHNWGLKIEDLSKDLKSLATDEYGNIEAVKHKKLSWWGIMWHPERNKRDNLNDMNLIKSLFIDY